MQEAYKAISDPTRRNILKYLRGGERTAGELAEYAGIGRTALSHHLTVLKLADLVRVERRGQFQVYALNTTVFQDLLTELMSWFSDVEATNLIHQRMPGSQLFLVPGAPGANGASLPANAVSPPASVAPPDRYSTDS
jgi:ArsR family transcriptional regulator, arsenate/arsenite/antimonite-responsive transcriptional repressor